MGWGSVLGGSATEKEPPCPPVLRRAILKAVRTSHARAVRRIHGDRGGYCRFSDRQYLPSSDGCSNTITGVQKDNLLLIEYDLPL